MGKRTPLFEIHKQIGAKIIDFGGWDMPLQYTNIIDEHVNARENAGLFDISHMAQIEIRGKDSFKFVQWLITNDISNLSAGKALYSPLCYENGTFVDDIIIYVINKNYFTLVVNASNADKDINWINEMSAGYSVEIIDVSNDTAQLALQGPKAENILKEITESDVSNIDYFEFVYGYLNSTRALISRTGYTGEDGFELYFSSKDAAKIWNVIIEAGVNYGIKPVGLGARDTLRLEACMRLYGNEIDDTVTPIEAGLDWTVKFNKDDFVGKKSICDHAGNISKKLVAFEMVEKSIARHNYPVFKDNRKIGYVTSGTFSPSLKKPIGMAYVDTKFANAAEVIEVLIRNKRFKANVISMPFIQKNVKRQH